MTELSYFHNGAFTGDASIAPYNDVEFHRANGIIYNNDYAPAAASSSSIGSRSNLSVTFVAGQTINVTTSGILVQGVYIECDEDLVLEDNNTAYPRLDTVIFRINWNTRQVEVLVKRGIASEYPEAIMLQQNFGDIWEQPLAYCYIYPAFAGFGTEYIYRIAKNSHWYFNYFLPTPPNEIFGFWYPSNKNVLGNGEFLSGPATAGDSIAPAMWLTTGTPVITNTEVLSSVASRNNRPLKITLTSTDTFYTHKYLASNRYKVATVSCLLKVVSGELNLSYNGGGFINSSIGPTAEPIELTFFVGASGGTTTITPHFSTSDEVEFYLWQVLMSISSVNPVLTPVHEYVLYGYPKELLDTNVESTTHDFDPDAGIANLIVQKLGCATSSAADSVYARLYPPSFALEALRTEIGRLPNSIFRDNQGWVSAAPFAPNTKLYAQHNRALSIQTINSVGIRT